MVKRNKIKECIIKVFWVFLVGSIIGYIVETIVAIVQTGHYESRQGLVYGPFIPVYGIGILLYYFIVPNIKDMKKVFLLSMLLGGLIEYMCSYIQEICFGTVSWDYSELWFNLNGRTSLLHCIYWGIAGVLFIKYIYPWIMKIDTYVRKRNFKVVTLILTVFMVFNITISCMAGQRQNERMQNIAAKDNIDVFLDTYYPDYVLNKIYANKINRKVPKSI